jgi:hypothetical protein
MVGTKYIELKNVNNINEQIIVLIEVHRIFKQNAIRDITKLNF